MRITPTPYGAHIRETRPQIEDLLRQCNADGYTLAAIKALSEELEELRLQVSSLSTPSADYNRRQEEYLRDRELQRELEKADNIIRQGGVPF